jgi:septal ring factor EnvC (AmiA/AmiB activator)
MSEKKRKRQALLKKLLSKRRFIIYNEDTLGESFSMRLNFLNMFVVFTLGAILIIFVTTFLIAFTPLREYIPGYASTDLKKEAVRLKIQTDSLLKETKQKNEYLASVKAVLTGQLEYAQLNKDSIIAVEQEGDEKDLSVTEEEKKLQKLWYEEQEPLETKDSKKLGKPIEGKITKRFTHSSKKYGIEILPKEDAEIKSIAIGTVVFTDKTQENNYIVLIKHTNNFISVYKNLDKIDVELGSVVQANEKLGVFEANNNKKVFGFQLWREGTPVNPEKYIQFK